MKIALITMHYQGNYGAVLQGFATQEILSKHGEVKTINYFNPYLQYKLDLIRFEPSIRGIKQMIHDLLRFKDRNKAIKRFKNFMEWNMNSSKLMTRAEIQNGAIGDFDVYVCGSDQIWNPGAVSNNDEFDPIYFLSFVPEKARKISYASSMGGYRLTNTQKKEQVKAFLKDFTTISVRESDTRERLSQLLGREVFQVLDPTLLLSKEEWLETLKIDENDRSQKEDYILVYRISRDSLLKKVVESFVKKFRYKVVIIDQALKSSVKADYHIKDAGPIEFVELFANARFVVTNSFHGSCFSINFKKPFVPVCPLWGANRIESLLNLFGLSEQFIKNEEDINKLDVDFDYEFLEKKLKEERAKSLQVLSSSILSYHHNG